MYPWEPLGTGFPSTEAPTNHPHGPYAPSFGSITEFGSPSGFHQGIQHEQPGSSSSFRQVLPGPSPPQPPENKGKGDRKRRIRSKTKKQLGKKPVPQILLEADQAISGVNDVTKESAKESKAKRSWTPELAQPSVDTLQQCLKDHALQTMDILLVIVENLRDNKLDVETVNRWAEEIGDVDAKRIPVESTDMLQVFNSLQKLNRVLIACLKASGPERSIILKAQALKLLDYIQASAEKYHLLHSANAWMDIGRWMERLLEPKMLGK